MQNKNTDQNNTGQTADLMAWAANWAAANHPPVPMTIEEAQEKLRKILKDGHLNMVIAGCAAEMCYQTGAAAHDAYLTMISAGIMADKHFGAQTDAWIAESRAQLQPAA